MKAPPVSTDNHRLNSELLSSIDSQKRILDLSIELLSLINDITDEDIREMRMHIKPELRDSFDAEEPNNKLAITALHRMGYDKLVALRDAKHGLYMVGIHEIRDHLAYIFLAVPEIKQRWEKEN